jgi:circadian clock protein KaiB
VSASTPDCEAGAPRLHVRLYVAGDGPNSARAVANLRAAIAELAHAPDDVEIVDVLQAPERGLRDGVLVTPMLVRVAPPPERRVLGNLSDRVNLLGVLSPREAPHE